MQFTFSSTSGLRKVNINGVQCSALNRSMLLASIALIRYSFTSSSGSFSPSIISPKPNLLKRIQYINIIHKIQSIKCHYKVY